MKRYDVWYDRQREKNWTYKTLPDALAAAAHGNFMVTERVSLGDPRLGFVEDIASVISDDPVLVLLRNEAQRVLKEAEALDFYRGY